MSFLEQKYHVSGWRGKKYNLTAKELYERVLEDSKSNYNWIAPAAELVSVCESAGFPEGYAQEIKILILNCFAKLELVDDVPARARTSDKEAVYHCYNTLDSTDEAVIAVKRKYLMAIIEWAVKYVEYAYLYLRCHPGSPAYPQICSKWKDQKFLENFQKEKINFKKLRKKLCKDFDNTITAAENAGVFEKDDEEYLNKLVEFVVKS